jgi:small subunit ribosomal protein S19
MSRSRKKGPYVDERLLARVERQEERGHRDPLKTWARDCTIVPEFVGHTFMIHNGRQFMRLFVTEDMVGHKLGEFAPTRVFKGHSGGKAKAAAAAAAAAGGAAPAAPAKGGKE